MQPVLALGDTTQSLMQEAVPATALDCVRPIVKTAQEMIVPGLSENEVAKAQGRGMTEGRSECNGLVEHVVNLRHLCMHASVLAAVHAPFQFTEKSGHDLGGNLLA
jgi:hypothetical protein